MPPRGEQTQGRLLHAPDARSSLLRRAMDLTSGHGPPLTWIKDAHALPALSLGWEFNLRTIQSMVN